MRIPAGTLSNFSDWRTNYPLIERDLPFNWFYDKNNYKLPMNRLGNSYDYLKINLEKVACRPILAMNMLASTYFHELAAFYSLHENNLPLRYIELGNEFYLNDEFYKEIFPSVNDYMDKALQWASDINDIPNFQNAKISIVGAISDENSFGRVRGWLDQVLERLKVANDVDAITLHDYINQGKANDPCAGSLNSSGIELFLLQSFVHITNLQSKELLQIQNFNDRYDPKDIWITEFNLDDDNDKRTGTWAHGLLGATLALKYLETPEITKIISHTMLSGAKFGNIFESNDAFSELSCHGNYSGKPTRKAEKSALGTALDGVATVLRHAIKGTPIDFSGARALGWNNNYDAVYGWTFEDAHGYLKTIVLNLSGSTYHMVTEGIYPNETSFNLNANVVSAVDQSRIIRGDGVVGSGFGSYEDLEINDNPWIGFPSTTISMPPFSLLIIDQDASNDPVRSSRLTDNEICSGSSTSLVIESNNSLTNDLPNCNGPITFGTPNVIGNRWIYSVEAGSVSATQTYTINPCADCDPIDITIHQNLSNLQIVPPATNIFCKGQSPITLEANFTPGDGGLNSLPYSFLWAPDSGIAFSSCSNSPMCSSIDVEPERTTTYQVYVTDGQCWSHADVEIIVPVANLNLGEDITICDGTSVNIIPNFDVTGTPNIVPNWTWGNGTGSSTQLILVTTPSLGSTTYQLNLDVNGCIVTDEIIVKSISCCDPGTSASIRPIEMFIPNTNQIHNEYYNHVGNLAAAINTTNCPTCSVSYTGFPNNNTAVEINGNSGTPTLFIDGEFRIPNDVETDNMNPGPEFDGMDLTLKNLTLSLGENAWINVMSGRKLVLQNCTLTSCGTNMWLGIVLDKKGERNAPEIEFLGTNRIENAQKGVYLTREAIYHIDGVVFDNCFIDIDVTNHRGPANSNSIARCTFQSSGAGLLAPHLGERKFAGIVLDDVSLINIGENSGTENIFTGSRYGILSNNSSVKLLNSDFSDIWDDPSNPLDGGCFVSTSDFDFTDRSIQVGNGAASGSCNFNNSISGIIGNGEMNYKIEKNIFGIGDGTNKILNYCIKISNNGEKEILIENVNKFYDYKHGIDISAPEGKIIISKNNFYNAFYSSSTNFHGTAINAFGFNQTSLYESEISENIIGTESGTDQPRIGIRLSKLDHVKISNNKIYYHQATIPSHEHIGIWVENCENTNIGDENIIKNTSSFPSGSFGMLVGLHLHISAMSCIEKNDFIGLGYGMQVIGNSIINSLYQNDFDQFDIGINFISADIGPTVGTQSTIDPDDGNVMGNTWNCAACGSVTNNRIGGQYSGIGVDWFTNTNTVSDEEYPDNSVSPVNIINPFP